MEGQDRPRLKVVELGSWLAAPGAAALLADLPAHVIKVEPAGGDPGRDFLAAMGSDKSSPGFSLLNRGKESIVLDLLTSSGRNRLDTLLSDADVFISNLRAGSLERLSLEPGKVMARFPRLIYASVTGMGLRGPDRDTGVFDVGGFWSRSGLMHQLQVPDSTPPSPTGGYGDMTTALAAYAGIVSALLQREWTGKGALVETSLLQTGAYVMSGDLAVQAVHGGTTAQHPRTDCRTPMVNSYRTQDDRWFFLTEIDSLRGFSRLCKAIDRQDLIGDPHFTSARAIRQNRDILIPMLDSLFASMPLDHWQGHFDAAGVLWQKIASPAEVLSDPQLHENGMLQPIVEGEATFPMLTSPFTIDRHAHPPRRAPNLGHDTDGHPAIDAPPASTVEL